MSEKFLFVYFYPLGTRIPKDSAILLAFRVKLKYLAGPQVPASTLLLLLEG